MSRDYQVRELTRGQSLPLEAIAMPLLDAICEEIQSAWAELLISNPGALASSEEAEINTLLQSVLTSRIGASPIWTQLVSCVVRGAESMNYDGGALEKRPDISLYLTGRSPAFPLTIECKILDHSKGVNLYAEKGISRYLSGNYAWASKEGFVVAYVRDESTIDLTLTPYLVKKQAQTPDPYATLTPPSSTGGLVADARCSVHQRAFVYVDGTGMPGNIHLWHLWLKV